MHGTLPDGSGDAGAAPYEVVSCGVGDASPPPTGTVAVDVAVLQLLSSVRRPATPPTRARRTPPS